MSKKRGLQILKLLIALGGLWYVITQIQWADVAVIESNHSAQKQSHFPIAAYRLDGKIKLNNGNIIDAEQCKILRGATATISQAKWGYVLVSFLLMGIVYPIQSFRWWVLMRSRKIIVPYLKVWRVWLIGCFMSFFMPGTTGGDLFKAYHAAKGAKQKGLGVLTVIVDRLLGLIGLLIVAGTLGLFHLDQPVIRSAVYMIAGTLTIVLVGAMIYFSRPFRKLRLFAWLENFKWIAKIDRGIIAYRHHKTALVIGLALSLVVQLLLALMGSLAAKAMGIQLHLVLVMSAVPLMMMMAAIPFTYQGFGVMEAVGFTLLGFQGGASTNQIVAMILLMRLFAVLYGLLGGLCLIKGDINLHHVQADIDQ